MATILLLTKIRESLPAQQARWITNSLSADPLVWASLQNIQPSADGVEFEPGNYANWSPAHLALRCIGKNTRPEDLAQDLNKTPEIELLQQGLKQFQETRRSNRAPKTLAEAAYLAIALRQHWHLESSWKGLLNQLTANGSEPDQASISVWLSAVACLYAMVPDPVEMLKGLLSRRASMVSFSLITHAILSNPLSESEQAQKFLGLIYGLPPLQQINWLRFLKLKGKDGLVEDIARLILNKIPASSASSLVDFNPDDWDIENLFLKLVELQRMAGLYWYANQSANARTALDKAQVTIGFLGAGLNLQLAEIARVNEQPAMVEQYLQASMPSLDTAAHLQQEVVLQLGGPHTEALFTKLPQASSHPVVQIYQSGALARERKLNLAVSMARQAVQQWMDLAANTAEVSIPNFGFDWQPREAIQILLDLGLIQESLQVIECLLAVRPTNQELLELGCIVWETQGNLDKALIYSEILASLASDNPDQHRHLAGLLGKKEDWQSAYDERSIVIKLANPTEIEDWLNLAVAASHLSRWEQVIDAANQALQIRADHGLAYALLGQAKMETGSNEEAAQMLQHATLLSPEESMGWLVLAEYYEKNGDAQKSLETLRAAVLAIPESGEINFKLARICLRQGLLSDGLPFLRKAASLSPESLDVSLELGQTLYSLGRLDEAYSALKQAHIKWPDQPELAFIYAQSALAAGDEGSALKALRVALKKDYPPAEWYILFAETLMGKDVCKRLEAGQDRGLIVEADQALDSALTYLPYHLGARLLKAEVLTAKGDLAEAYEQYRQLLETSDATSPTIRWRMQAGLGSVSLKMGQAASALVSLQEAVQTQPENIGLLHILANAFKAGDLVNEALATANNALKLAPDDLENLSWFAEIMAELGEPLEAVHALNVVNQLAPTCPEYWIRTAALYCKLGDTKSAAATLEKLMEITPLGEAVLQQAALVYLEIEDSTSAIQCLKRAAVENKNLGKKMLVELAQLDWENKEYVDGLEIIQRAIDEDPEDGYLYVFQADFMTRLDRFEAAIACLEHGLNLAGPSGSSRNDFWKDLDSSKFIAKGWIETICDVTRIHVRFAKLYRRTGSLASAYQHASLAYETELTSPQLALFALDHAVAMNLTDEAEKLAKEFDFDHVSGATLSEEDRASLAGLLAVHAGLLMDTDMADKAQECIEKGFEIDGQNARVEAVYARLLVKRGNWIKAGEAFSKAEEFFRTDLVKEGQEAHFPAYWLGMAAIEMGYSTKAIEIFSAFVKDYPNEPLAHFGLGRALAETAENQRLFAEYQCVHWLPEQNCLTDDRYEEFEKAIQNSARLANSDKVEVWRQRGRAAFRPTTQNLRALMSFLPDPEIAESLVAGLRRAENPAEALQVGEQFPEHVGVQTQVAFTHLNMESIAGLNIARAVVAKNPDQVLGWITLAVTARKFGELADAYMALQQANSFWPDEPVWQSWAGELAAMLENNQECVQHWEIAVVLRPDYFPFAMALGGAYLRNNQPYQAITALEKASQLNPNRSDLWFMLAQAYRQTGQQNVALQCAEKSSSLEPDSIQPQLLCGEIYLTLGEKDAAQRCALWAWNQDKANETSLLFLVKVLIGQGKSDEALSTLEQVKGVLNSDRVELERARLISKKRGPLAALPLLQKLAQSNPEDVEVRAILANAQAECGDFKAAAKSVNEGLAVQPFHPELNYLAGKMQHGEGQLDNAVHFLSQAIQNDPTMVDAYLELARTYQERRETKEAVQILQTAARIAPKDYRPFYNAALLLRDNKDYVGSETLLRRAAELAPEDVNIRRQLGAVVTLNLIHNSQEASTAHESIWSQDVRR